ncbi:phosphoenolpyruvate--protein phosphotransferase [Photobacterium sp.]|uniref:phosphoenolpyruvate--protein phosphotransferase n=1 Tax=Photobacterium sp. TaxID=660 RepID=UPI00299D4972|nr:phosphoenolpyruvate--protein phosphotransferase [Photobacterium sp.]MDX1303121.1 phosphoenolpyruvate--protein phosphotransferase [Photobacterium sp.]
MVSIVIVSHSPDLAKGVHALAAQMTQGKVKIAVAAGVDDPENPIGTDAVAVMMAIEEVYSPQGVLVLVDMGSAILSTDMALELISSEQAANVHVCAAPLIEGAMSASVAAAAGMPLDEVINEAHSALLAKYQLLDQSAKLPGGIQANSQPDPVESENEIEFEWRVKNPHGIHARPASAIVGAISPFDAQVWLNCHDTRVSAKSINSIALLGVKQGDSLTCITSGKEAQQALQAFALLAESHFNESIDERSDEVVVAAPHQVHRVAEEDGRLSAIGASEGIAIAPIWHYRITMPEARKRDYLDYEQEWQLFDQACDIARRDLAELANQTATAGSKSESEIFTAHSQMLADPELGNQIKQMLKDAVNVDSAWLQVIEQTAQAYKDSSSEYMQARANDVYDVGRRVMGLLIGETEPQIVLTEPVILVATDLSPSDTAQLDPHMVQGIILEQGGSTSHSAILARALGIPAVVGLNDIMSRSQEGDVAIINGSSGDVWLAPMAQQLATAQQELEGIHRQREQDQALAMEKAKTQDGKLVDVFANLASVEDAEQALACGAEGVGLVRSEFLFMDSEQAPSEQSQYEFYSRIAGVFGEKPVIIRTLDIGGDKPLAYLQQGAEENPFLGCRGLRLCLQNVDIFKLQLNALLRARAEHPNLQVMFPMVSTPDELRQAKSLLESCYQALQHDGVSAAIPEIGIMIEVPAAVANAKQLAKEVSFFSIGTNDLTQYVMAADRGNDAVSYLVSAAQPAVLRMIEMAAQAAHDAGITIGICGEMAGDPKLTATLIGLGIDELSMSPIRIAGVKQAVRTTQSKHAALKAKELLNAETLGQVLAML